MTDPTPPTSFNFQAIYNALMPAIASLLLGMYVTTPGQPIPTVPVVKTQLPPVFYSSVPSGLAAELRQALLKRNVALADLAAKTKIAPDSVSVWNTGYKAAEDAFAVEGSAIIGAALRTATSLEDRAAVWDAVQSAYSQ